LILKKTFIKAFTLIELLVVIIIISILASMLLPVLAESKMAAKKANEISSSKQLILGWHLYSEDHDGKVLPGYRNGFEAFDLNGNPLVNPINVRYPWRLIPWLGDSFELIYANENRGLLDEFRSSYEDYSYAVSLFPSLGVNSRFVGGDDVDLAPTNKAISKFGSFCLLNTSESKNSSGLIVFSSSRHKFGDRMVGGFYLVKSPYFAKREWESDLDLNNSAPSYGYVHHRYKGRAVNAFIDGHSEVLTFQAMDDMRKWCNIADSRDWVMARNRNE
jgi:prepilin-type N-terminal cleavage/methylation domain-containing protein|tara:strand:- start:368 stop:1192 length:825 start_codon:yes stop_codon:yes gene_type:complete